MAWAMNDEAVKVQLFRFIDVLPMLTTPEDIARHLEEYLDDVRDRLPSGGPLWFGDGHAHRLGPSGSGGRCPAKCDDPCEAVHCRNRR